MPHLRLLQINAQLLQRSTPMSDTIFSVSSPSPHSYENKTQQKHDERNHAHVFPLAFDVGRPAVAKDETYVKSVFSSFKTGSLPKLGGPRAGTILPSVRPSKRTCSVLGSALYAKTHSAHAALLRKQIQISSVVQ